MYPEVKFVRVTLEKPWVYGRNPKGSLRVRLGSTDAVKNPDYNPKDQVRFPRYLPGHPIWYPADGPAIAGDEDRDSWIMESTAARDAFGDWNAPEEEDLKGIPGHTIGSERERVARLWFGWKICNGDGTMHPPMYRIGVPAVPIVSIHFLDGRNRPMKDEKNQPIVIRPWDMYHFESFLDALPEEEKTGDAILSSLTTDEVEFVRMLVKELREKGVSDILKAMTSGKEQKAAGTARA